MSSIDMDSLTVSSGVQPLKSRGKRRHAPDPEEQMRHNQRARDNQQRCRARRKELLNDLQRRVEIYERQGVQATQEMQQAARRVAGENARLRALLKRKGVSDSEVEEWVRLGDVVAGPVQGQDAEKVAVGAPLHQSIAPATAPFDLGHPPAEPPTPPASTSSCQTAQTPPASTASYQLASLPPLTPFVSHEVPMRRNSGPSPNTVLSASSASLARSGDARAVSMAGGVTECYTSPNETSCEVAAAILASMHGHGDTERAREALGCTDPGDCTVKNTRILELLDQAG